MKIHPLLLMLGAFTLAPHTTAAQESFEEYRRQKLAEFNRYRNEKQKEFAEYRAQRNKEFAEYLAKGWISYKLNKGKAVPKAPDPVKPTVAPKDQPAPKPVEVPVKEVVKPTTPSKPKPIEFPIEAPKPTKQKTSFQYYGTTCQVYFKPSMKFTLKGITERNIAQAYTTLSGDAYNQTLTDLRDLYTQLSLNDYGLLMLADRMAKALLGTGNEACVLACYVMNQFGYDVRLCRANNRLGLMIPYKQEVCETDFYNIDGRAFYVFDTSMNGTSVSSYGKNLKGATRQVDCSATTTPKLAMSKSAPRTVASKAYPAASITATVNKNLMDYYYAMPPVGDWSFYANTPLDNNLKQQIYPRLRQVISGQSETKAANILLNLVQTGFNYLTDQEQFKREKYNFGEENFYYKACDCEDRSILYAHLVRDLIGLDVVLLHYPNHIATAVCFGSEVSGSYVNVNGKKYIVCDPTYINASIGSCMPQFVNTKPTVYRTH